MTKIPDPDKTSTNGRTIFISRQIGASSPLQELLKEGHTVHAESLITTSKIRFTYTPKSDWIFFPSKNAIRYFFSQDPELAPNVKFAVMGEASERFLHTFNKNADFVGKGVDVTRIAKEFAGKIGNETVLFPQAISSLQSMQKQLSFSNICYNLFVYKTSVKVDFEIPAADILVFTSPSNVRTYFAKYQYQAPQKVVAIGTTTAEELRNYGVKEVSLAAAFSEDGLLQSLQKLLADEKISTKK